MKLNIGSLIFGSVDNGQDETDVFKGQNKGAILVSFFCLFITC